MRWSGLVTLLTCCLVTAGCATTVTGSAVPVTAGTSAGTSTALTCSGGAVLQPKSAPYCFPLPAGFVDITDNVTLQYQSANRGQYLTAIDIARLDTITVSIYPLRTNSDPLTLDFLTAQLQHALPDPATTGITAGRPTTTTLDGARAVRFDVDKAGSYSSTVYFAFRGYTELELDCQWAQHQADIDRGCAAVRGTLRFVDQRR